jgi:putative FmdB family regulatory protein
MPIYEYECIECGNRFEILQRFDEKPLIRCKRCKGQKIRRLMSTAAFIFKGSGFYATDYKTKERKREKNEVPGCSSCAESGTCPASKTEK